VRSQSRLTARDIYLVSNTRENNGTRGAVPRVSSSITFASFLRKHLQTLLYLIKDNPPELSSPAWSLPGSGSSGVGPVAHNQDTARYTIWITAEEVDRLDLLLAGRLVERRNSREAKGISCFLPCFRNRNGADMAGASGVEIAQCLKKSILDSEGETDSIGRICGVTKGTTVEGEGSFPNDQLVIRECQDSCIYALTPLARAKVTACSDCIIVLGPTSGCVIVENCTRIKMIYAATSTCITACHESILHLAATRSPYLIGDNRFLQLGPFNIDYERLGAHLEMSGLQIRPNRWDKPALLNWFKREEESSMSSRLSTSDGRNEAKFDDLIMHPDQLLPFTIPFKGAPGPLAGGAPNHPQSTWVNKLMNGEGSGPVFPLSPDYARALTAKLRGVAELQESVSKVGNGYAMDLIVFLGYQRFE